MGTVGPISLGDMGIPPGRKALGIWGSLEKWGPAVSERSGAATVVVWTVLTNYSMISLRKPLSKDSYPIIAS